MQNKKLDIRDILPSNGLWDIESLAGYLNLDPLVVAQKLRDWGVKVLSFSRLYRHKLFWLEDLRKDLKQNG